MNNLKALTLATNAIDELLKSETDEKRFAAKYSMDRKKAREAIPALDEMIAVEAISSEVKL